MSVGEVKDVGVDLMEGRRPGKRSEAYATDTLGWGPALHLNPCPDVPQGVQPVCER